jgi:non-ribosomal peptide synthetase component F
VSFRRPAGRVKIAIRDEQLRKLSCLSSGENCCRRTDGKSTRPVVLSPMAFKLWLGIGEIAKGGMTGNLMYDTTVFSRRTVAAIAASFTACLERVVSDPGVSLDDLDARIVEARAEALVPRCLAPSAESAQSAVARLCDATERGALADGAGVAAGPLVHAWGFLEAGVAAEAAESIASASRPVAAICDVGDGVVMTYADLELQARAVAGVLLNASSQERARVSVLAPNGWGVLALQFATALAGGVVGNHNTHLVAPELAYQLERFEPHVIAAAGDALSAVADAALALTGIGRSDSSPAPFRLNLPWDHSTFLTPRVDRSPVGTSPADPYMLYFTSGTSGKPKGVMLTQDIVCRHAVGTIAEMRLHSGDVWLHAAPMFHLVDAFAMYAITAVGGTHVSRPVFDASATLRLMQQEGVTVLNMASTMVVLMCASPVRGLVELSSLRLVSCGGSPLAAAVVKRAIGTLGCEFFVSEDDGYVRLTASFAVIETGETFSFPSRDPYVAPTCEVR